VTAPAAPDTTCSTNHGFDALAIEWQVAQPLAGGVREGVGERLENNEYRQQHYAELFVRLVNGEVDADLPGYDDSDL
jgi:hypothetical protein